MTALRFDPPTLPPGAEALREEVRRFLADERAKGTWSPRGDFGTHPDTAFSRLVGQQGWIGMTWPRQYGGHERSGLERYVVTEELLVSGAPITAHWIADRQSGPLILRVGTEAQKQRFLPAIARGEIFFCIGMSEPDSGSDLVSIRTKGTKVEGGWRITGRKVWTSNAHICDYAITLVRTGPQEPDRHSGLSQFILDLKAPGVEIRPIRNLAGHHDFNEMILDDVFLADDMLVGQPGDGWKQVTSELAFERSGPERFLSTYRLLAALVDRGGTAPDDRVAEATGRFVAHMWALRGMSLSIAGMLQAGETPNLEAACVKDLGNAFERAIPETARLVAPSAMPVAGANDPFETIQAEAVLNAPSITLRGGTREILRGIIARGLGLR
ncbi:alkylation response protein AidB-like acyl-CoA dehydrogenase [Stella humosa]|uniref:Alkylation response protein AidB-like acyl-CoA dehydrogenase n=1 Tax=Stella humosa TaxID=94 RepID=A0A3N1M2U9_9PROT|nr:acyl-CoA dehydrogenase family protein [Stella humosa]ROQ01864.1 alkylation response protein AidB-like acyl-CoA dehydrogenase [Stella humosa]BBK32253.1 acyl-CoA dehydrogenase [Stella humosa]